MKSDNGPPFTSYEFKSFVEERGIQHQRIAPLWSQGNSEAERFMKSLTKAICTAHAEGRDWHKDLFVFLLNYRAIAHVATGVSHLHCCLIVLSTLNFLSCRLCTRLRETKLFEKEMEKQKQR